MSPSIRSQQNELRANLRALARACPFDHTNPEDCPLCSLRKMKQRARSAWCQALGTSDLAFLAAYHHVCLNLKLEARPGVPAPRRCV
jgi:hypothetical protein